MHVIGKHEGEFAGRGKAPKLLAIGEAGKAPGAAIRVETYLLVRRMKVAEVAGCGGGRVVGKVLEFNIETVFRKDFLECKKDGAGLLGMTGVDQISDLSLAAAGQADQPFSVDAQGV